MSCFILPAAVSELNAFRLRQAWEASEFNGCHMFPERVEPALQDALTALATAARADPSAGASPDAVDPPPLACFVIAERHDASCVVAVSDDLMNAEATVVTAQGGAALDEAMMCRALEAAGVRSGSDDEAIADLVAQGLTVPPGTVIRRMIARGRRPAAGIPSVFENLVVSFQDRILKPQEREDGSIDFLDLGRIETVENGAELVRRHPACAGENGLDVLGRVIASTVPPETPFAPGDGAEIDGQDPHLLRATRTGVPHRVANGMSVNDVLQVGEVDLHTGHVEFDGSLVVKGDVHADMRVRVTGDLIVTGFVESADVEAGGDITIKQSIMGPAAAGAAHTCRVKGRNISATYAQNAILEAAEDISLRSHLLHSQVLACRDLVVGGERNRGARIVGGAIHASRSVTTGELGAEAETETRVVMDDRIQHLRLESDAQHAHRMHLQETAQWLEQSLRDLYHLPRSEPLVEKMTRIANTIRAYRDELQQLDEEDETRRQQIAELAAAVRVIALARIHAGVEVQCMDARYRYSMARGAAVLGVRDGNWTDVEA